MVIESPRFLKGRAGRRATGRGTAMYTVVAVFLCLATIVFAAPQSDPAFDHQTRTYSSSHKPSYCSNACSVTPFFSPDHSIDTYVKLIQEAEYSIDLYTPGFDSWSGCTPFKGCIGCSIDDQRNETFPVFPALLNAVHQRKVTVRILTNDYNSVTCTGKIAPLDWLSLNGIEVRFYTSTTFMHSKYMMIDKGKKTSVSSVNFSYTSFMKNREAGVVLSSACSTAVQFYSSVFESDWNQGLKYKVNQQYNSSALKAITNPSPMPVNIPLPHHISGAYVTSLHTYSSVNIKKVYTAPDFARNTVFDTLAQTQASFYLMIYQVTDEGLCDKLLSMHNKSIDVRLLVSDRIYGYADWKKAQACYAKLYAGGMEIRKTPSYYTYSHQKFWIVDNTTVHLSSGNWSPSDFPTGDSFPPYPSSSWQDTNRDSLVTMESTGVVQDFYTVFTQDWMRGKDWTPKTARYHL